MVQINFFVAFILAAVALAPVVALPRRIPPPQKISSRPYATGKTMATGTRRKPAELRPFSRRRSERLIVKGAKNSIDNIEPSVSNVQNDRL